MVDGSAAGLLRPHCPYGFQGNTRRPVYNSTTHAPIQSKTRPIEASAL
jgi:hypothetical protein